MPSFETATHDTIHVAHLPDNQRTELEFQIMTLKIDHGSAGNTVLLTRREGFELVRMLLDVLWGMEA